MTTVGGAPEDDLFASGMQPGHLRIERDPTTDRHEVVPVPVALTLVDGQPLEVPVVLRTGTVLRAGDLEFSYVREQYADQGRPNGGRQAGEL
ncbi:FHA domain-containing protein [Ornithinimicrobium sufpigmenti]|uniref:FHA domain-containing protein n=1 Tax=Ornithinimicrobium sufpigmenti TaxID=2508882 RepID=UPI0010364DE1|nr:MULTISPECIES: FHA domain-containing protein [unclassified Ornithinimicrobium]